jgi:hypothetical protein
VTDATISPEAAEYFKELHLERPLLLAVAREASAFLDQWSPQTDRFIEATLGLDEALNRVQHLLERNGA